MCSCVDIVLCVTLSGRCTHVSVAVAGLQRDCYGNEEAVAVAARGKGCNAVRASPSLLLMQLVGANSHERPHFAQDMRAVALDTFHSCAAHTVLG